jgi:YbbR domain-containing protein
VSGTGVWSTLRGLRLPAGTLLRLLSSFVLALLLWGWVTDRQNPPIERTFEDVPLREPQLEPPLQIVGDLGDEAVRVLVEGPSSLVEELVLSDLEPHLDLSPVETPGTYTLPVEVPLPNGVELRRVTPRQVTILVDEVATESFHLDPVVVPTDDDTRRVGEIVPSVTEVTVSGPRQIVEDVAAVVLPVDIGERTSDFRALFAPEARNGDGEPITEVQIQPARVEAEVPVETRGRSVPVLIETVGDPAQGYEVVDTVANPDMVVLDGPDDVVNEVVSVSTAPIGIEGATEPVNRSVELTGLPPGVSVVEPADGNVVVVVQVAPRRATQTLTDLTVTVTDLAPGLTARIQPTTADVDIVAAEDILAALQAGDVVPRASVAGLGPGQHRVTLDVSVPAGVQWLETDPQTVEVAIEAAGTPGATAVAG